MPTTLAALRNLHPAGVYSLDRVNTRDYLGGKQTEWGSNLINGVGESGRACWKGDGTTSGWVKVLPITVPKGPLTLMCRIYVPTTSGTGLIMGIFVAEVFPTTVTYGLGWGIGATTMDTAGNNAIGLAEDIAWATPGGPYGTGWMTAVMSFDDINAWRFYKDGALIGSSTTAVNFSASHPSILIGGYNRSGAGPSNRHSVNSIAWCAWWRRVLTAGEIISVQPATVNGWRSES